MNFQEILNQTVTYKGHTLKFIDFVHRFKTKKDIINSDNIVLCPRTNYYIKLLDEHKNLKFFWSWNWAAFFTGTVPWLLYRKMYAFTLSLMIYASTPICLCKILSKFYKIFSPVGIITSSILIIISLSSVAMPSIANYAYFSKIARDINACKPVPKSNTNLTLAIIVFIVSNSIAWCL